MIFAQCGKHFSNEIPQNYLNDYKILGDSSSSSIGEREHTYGFKLFEKLSKKRSFTENY